MKTLPNIRAATNGDSPEILRLIFDIWIHEYAFKVKPEDYPDLQDIESHYFENGGLFLVALEQGKIIGTIAYDSLDGSSYVLKRMFVHKDSREKGIAQRLLDAVFGHESLQGPCSLYLSTKENLALAAKKFYLKNGFKIIGRKELPSRFPLFYEDDLFMKKDFLEGELPKIRAR